MQACRFPSVRAVDRALTSAFPDFAAQGPYQHNQQRIVDVAGTRLVITAYYVPSATRRRTESTSSKPLPPSRSADLTPRLTDCVRNR